MPTAISLEVLPARMGDCLVVECPRTDGTVWRMLVDGGPPDTWPVLERRLRRLDPPARLDVVMVTHIDSDHIGGLVPFFASDLVSRVDDVWFNGRTHLGHGGSPRSVGQGEDVVAALLGTNDLTRHGSPMPWNVAFGGGPVVVAPDSPQEVAVPGGPTITVLSPTVPRLTALRASWAEALEAARHGHRDVPPPREVFGALTDLPALASARTPEDTSVPNGSSIALLVEHRGASVLLGADAYGTVLRDSLRTLAAARGVPAIAVDVVKLPHHGSKANVLTDLVAAAPARQYLVSSNGDVFAHPDDAALARVVLGAPHGATLGFNYRNPRTQRWADPALTDRYGYTATYPEAGDPETGLVLRLPV